MKYVWIFLQSAWLIILHKSFQHLYEGSKDITLLDSVIIQMLSKLYVSPDNFTWNLSTSLFQRYDMVLQKCANFGISMLFQNAGSCGNY